MEVPPSVGLMHREYHRDDLAGVGKMTNGDGPYFNALSNQPDEAVSGSKRALGPAATPTAKRARGSGVALADVRWPETRHEDNLWIIGNKNEKTRESDLTAKSAQIKDSAPHNKLEYLELPIVYKSADQNLLIRREELFAEGGPEVGDATPEERRDGQIKSYNDKMKSFGLLKTFDPGIAGNTSGSSHQQHYTRSQIDGVGRDKYPDIIAIVADPDNINGSRLVARWHASEDIGDRRQEINSWAGDCGKGNIYKAQRNLAFRKLDQKSISENWSASADFMVMEGWPRVAVRVGPNFYMDYDQYRTPTAARGNGGNLSSPPRDVLILTKSGDGYLAPHELKAMEPEAHAAMMREAHVPLELANRVQQPGPEQLFCRREPDLVDGRSRLVRGTGRLAGSTSYAAAREATRKSEYNKALPEFADRKLDERSLVRMPLISNEVTPSYALLAELMDRERAARASEGNNVTPATAARNLHPRARSSAR